jgi:hypothetical protein
MSVAREGRHNRLEDVPLSYRVRLHDSPIRFCLFAFLHALVTFLLTGCRRPFLFSRPSLRVRHLLSTSTRSVTPFPAFVSYLGPSTSKAATSFRPPPFRPSQADHLRPSPSEHGQPASSTPIVPSPPFDCPFLSHRLAFLCHDGHVTTRIDRHSTNFISTSPRHPSTAPAPSPLDGAVPAYPASPLLPTWPTASTRPPARCSHRWHGPRR